jgi:hypothetical protein
MVKAPQNPPNLRSCSSSLNSPRLKNSSSRCEVEWRYMCRRPVSTYHGGWCRPWRLSLSYLATAVHAAAPPPLPLIEAQNLKDRNWPYFLNSIVFLPPIHSRHETALRLHYPTIPHICLSMTREDCLHRGPCTLLCLCTILQSLRDHQGDHAFQSSSL